jgi:hypothetical protein
MDEAPILIAGEGACFRTLEITSGRLRDWDFASGGVTADRGELAEWPGQQRYNPCVVREDRRRVAIGSRAGLVWQWDLATGRRLPPIIDFRQPCAGLSYSPDGRWLAVHGEDVDVALFDPDTGKRAGPLLTEGVPVRALAFTRSDLLTALADGRCTRWPLPPATSLTPEQWERWLETATGMRQDGELLVPLTIAAYRERASDASQLPLPLALPQTSAPEWHADQALAAENAGQMNGALWHLDRWVTAAPNAWLPRARRARIYAAIGDSRAVDADFDRARQLDANGVAQWNLHQAALGRITGRPLQAGE